MIDYSKIKIGFTNGDDFALSSQSYVGYYHVIDGQPYQGRNAYDVATKLNAKSNLSSNVLTSKLFYDRIITDSATLPYKYDKDIFIAPNETCNSRLFNDRILKLYNNAIYLYSQLFLASNDIPNGYNRAAGTSKASLNLGWSTESFDSGASFAPFASAGYAQIDEAIAFEAVKTYNDATVYLGITPTAFVAMAANKDLTTLDVVNINSFVSENNDLQFSQLTSFSVAGNYAYLCDVLQNTIYKYDVSGYFSGDSTIANRRILVDSIGGFGNALAQTKFNAPDLIYANDEINRLFVHDRNNRCIKVYDTKLSFVRIRTFTAGSNSVAKAMAYNSVNQFMYLIIQNAVTNEHVLQVCDKNLQLIEQYSLTDALESNEMYKGIVFSKNDSNFFYIFTNRGVYKKFVSKPDRTIGKWLIYKSGITATHIWNLENSKYNLAKWNWNEGALSVRDALTIAGMSSFFISDIDDREQIFLFVGANEKPFNRILHYSERNVFNSAMGATNLNAYDVARARVGDDEFVNAMVINKELYKIAFNTLNIIRFITGRYVAEFDYLNNLVYKNIMSLTDSEFAAINSINLQNIYVYENEIMSSSSTLNRCFKEIYNLQNQALQVVRTKINNVVSSLSGTQTIVLN